jgi:hypothetical protein
LNKHQREGFANFSANSQIQITAAMRIAVNPAAIPIDADSGYQGLQELHPNCRIPARASKKHKLTATEKAPVKDRHKFLFRQ